MRLSLFAVAAVVVLSGCNTYFQNSYQKIMVRTPGVENANCDLYTDKNRYIVMTPRLVVVERSNLPITVVCEKTGYYPASVVVRSRIYAAPGVLNVVNGLVPGMAYDVASNSIYDYPDTVLVTLLPIPPEAEQPEETPYVLEKKPVPMKPAPVVLAPPPAAADQSLNDSLKK